MYVIVVKERVDYHWWHLLYVTCGLPSIEKVPVANNYCFYSSKSGNLQGCFRLKSFLTMSHMIYLNKSFQELISFEVKALISSGSLMLSWFLWEHAHKSQLIVEPFPY